MLASEDPAQIPTVDPYTEFRAHRAHRACRSRVARFHVNAYTETDASGNSFLRVGLNMADALCVLDPYLRFMELCDQQTILGIARTSAAETVFLCADRTVACGMQLMIEAGGIDGPLALQARAMIVEQTYGCNAITAVYHMQLMFKLLRCVFDIPPYMAPDNVDVWAHLIGSRVSPLHWILGVGRFESLVSVLCDPSSLDFTTKVCLKLLCIIVYPQWAKATVTLTPAAAGILLRGSPERQETPYISKLVRWIKCYKNPTAFGTVLLMSNPCWKFKHHHPERVLAFLFAVRGDPFWKMLATPSKCPYNYARLGTALCQGVLLGRDVPLKSVPVSTLGPSQVRGMSCNGPLSMETGFLEALRHRQPSYTLHPSRRIPVTGPFMWATKEATGLNLQWGRAVVAPPPSVGL